MRKVLAVARRELSMGFALAGTEVVSAEDADHALRAVEDAIGSREYGIIAIDQGLLDRFDRRKQDELMEMNLPLIIPVPGDIRWKDTEEVGEESYVAGLLRRAVGYQVNINL